MFFYQVQYCEVCGKEVAIWHVPLMGPIPDGFCQCKREELDG